MELDVAIVGGILLLFVSVLSYKAFSKYNKSEEIKQIQSMKNDQVTLIYENKIKDLENSNRNYIYKIRRARENFDINYDDIEYDEENEDEEFKLSELATSIYPKLPPSLAKLIDKEEFQNAIIKTVEKKPDILNTFIDKFLGKGKEEGSNSNSALALKELYL